MKQIRALLDENKTLKTNMYWLTKELKSAKNKDERTRRLRLDSGGLEGMVDGLCFVTNMVLYRKYKKLYRRVISMSVR